MLRSDATVWSTTYWVIIYDSNMFLIQVIVLQKSCIALARVINYTLKVTLQIVVSLTDDSWGVIYDRNKFIVHIQYCFKLVINICFYDNVSTSLLIIVLDLPHTFNPSLFA